MENKNKKYSWLGCLPKALLWNFIVGAMVFLADIFLGGPKIYIENQEAIFVFSGLLALCLAITGWGIWALTKHWASENLVTDGPYHFVRHPISAAIIFILNPALGILFRSWLLVLSSILIYFVWKKYILTEEKLLAEKFGQAYLDYCSRVNRFFPRLWPTNKITFYGLLAISIFSVTFVSLNSGAFYLRWVSWEEKEGITYDQSFNPEINFFSPGQNIAANQQPSNFFNSSGEAIPDSFSSLPLSPKANYNASPNSIYIAKINTRAPIVLADGTKQAQLNAALDQGVVLYPGSALPGQSGETAISGHSSVFPWNKTSYGQVFTLLDKVENGDVISIVYNNYQYDYQVTGKAILLPSQVKTSPTAEQKLLLSTCWPIGTALKRLVVYAELIK